MLFWQWLWTALWFGGLAIFTILTAVITVQGARDLPERLMQPPGVD